MNLFGLSILLFILKNITPKKVKMLLTEKYIKNYEYFMLYWKDYVKIFAVYTVLMM